MSADVALDPGRGIQHGIEAIKRIPIHLWLGGAILGFTEGGAGGCGGNPAQILDLVGEGGGGSWDTGGGFDFDWDDLSAGLDGLHAGLLQEDAFGLMALGATAIFGLICCVGVFVVLMFALRCWILPGWYRLHEECLRTGSGDFATLFSGSDLFLRMVLWSLLKGLILAGVTLIGLVPLGLAAAAALALESVPVAVLGGGVSLLLLLAATLYVQPGLAFGGEAVTFDGLGVMDALARSWSLARGNRIQLIVFFVVLGVVKLAASIVGLCLCFVGVLVTGPLARGGTDLACTEAYLILTRGVEVTDDWALLRPVVATPTGPAGPPPAEG